MSLNHKKNERPSILIVDDERGTREALAKFLRPSYEVTIAEDGEIGCNLLARNNYDTGAVGHPHARREWIVLLETSLKEDAAPPCSLHAYGSIGSRRRGHETRRVLTSSPSRQSRPARNPDRPRP